MRDCDEQEAPHFPAAIPCCCCCLSSASASASASASGCGSAPGCEPVGQPVCGPREWPSRRGRKHQGHREERPAPGILANFCVDGRYLNHEEQVFVSKVLFEGNAFLEKRFSISISNRYRYLLHQTIADHYGDHLRTLSVGKDKERRTAVYFKARMEREDIQPPDDRLKARTEPMVQAVDALADGKAEVGISSGLVGREEQDEQEVEEKEIKSGHCKGCRKKQRKRPDKPLYMPPKAKSPKETKIVAKEKQQEKDKFPQSEEDVSDQGKETSSCESPVNGVSLPSNSSPRNSSHQSQGNSLSDDVASLLLEGTEKGPQLKPLTSSDSNSFQTSCSQRVDSGDEGGDESNWDSLFDDNGDCVKPELLQELEDSLLLRKGQRTEDEDNTGLKVEATKLDYFNFTPFESEVNDNTFSHILEVYDFASDLKTQDLITCLSVFNSRDFEIKWVDETHALVVFPSEALAVQALKAPYHNMRLRPMSQAIKESKIKAKTCSESLRTSKQRPQTSASLARRLVTGALGLKVNISPEQRAEERKRLQQAKERRKLNHKQTNDVWEGNVS